MRSWVLSLTVIVFLVLTAPLEAETSSPPADSGHRWNLAELFETEEAWEASRARFESRFDELRAAMDGWTDSPAEMLALLELDCELEQHFFRLIYYADLAMTIDETEPRYKSMQGQMLALIGAWQSITAPMDTELLALGEARFEEYVAAEPALDAFAYEMREVFREAERALPEELERFVQRSFALSMQPRVVYQSLMHGEVPWGEATLTDGSVVRVDDPALSRLLRSPVAEDRRRASEAHRQSLARFENTFAALLNNEMQAQHFQATVRGYDSALEARFLRERLDPAIFGTAIAKVREHIPLYHRFLALQKRMLGIGHPTTTDLFAPNPLAKERSFSFDEARAAVRTSLAPLGDEYNEGVRRAFEEGWFDVYPRAKKRGFGGVTSVYGLHPFILLNFAGSYRDTNVVTHELGHAIHFWLVDRHHPCVNSSIPSYLFEIAAHFNEQLLIEHLLENESDPRVRIFLLTRHLESLTAALFHQARLSEFEHAMHRRVESGGSLDATWLNERYLASRRLYYGHEQGIIDVGDSSGTGWIGIDYLFRSYYAYNYTAGMVAALAYKEQFDAMGEEGVAAYLDFLRSSGSEPPLALLARTGVDMRSELPYQRAFRQVERLVDALESAIREVEASS